MQQITTGADSTQKIDPRDFADIYVALDGDEKQAFAERLRALADFIEHTEAPISRYSIVNVEFGTYDLHDDEEKARWGNVDVVALRRLIGGKVRKLYPGDQLLLQKLFAKEHTYPQVSAGWRIAREAVCEQVPVLDDDGEPVMEEVKTMDYSDAERAEKLKEELEALRVVERRPKMEWDCKPILDGDVDSTATEMNEPELPSPAKELTA